MNGHADETLSDVVDWSGIERGLMLRMKRTLYTPGLRAGEIQPVIDVAARYKVIEKPFPAADLISEAAVRG